MFKMQSLQDQRKPYTRKQIFLINLLEFLNRIKVYTFERKIRKKLKYAKEKIKAGPFYGCPQIIECIVL